MMIAYDPQTHAPIVEAFSRRAGVTRMSFDSTLGVAVPNPTGNWMVAKHPFVPMEHAPGAGAHGPIVSDALDRFHQSVAQQIAATYPQGAPGNIGLVLHPQGAFYCFWANAPELPEG